MATDSFTIGEVLAWARTKPAGEKYEYSRGVWDDERGGCALCHFLRDTGRATKPLIWPGSLSNGGGEWQDGFGSKSRLAYPGELERPLLAGTFGALVERLEKLCPETPVPQSNWARLDAYMADIETVSA